jgi:acetylornithine deacetylase/succinyl-diaminopimelate desuccinylase-like protein
VLETEEESGSDNLKELLKKAEDIIKIPDILLCLDSGCLDYEQLWLTSSLRGFARVDVKISFGLVGYHSGETGGIIPETFRIARVLLDRIDDSVTGKVCEEL